MPGTFNCGRCNKVAANTEVGWGTCATCGRLLCPADIARGCDGAEPAVLVPPGEAELRMGSVPE